MYAIALPLRGFGNRTGIAGFGRSLRELHAGCAGMSLRRHFAPLRGHD
jgi:hypothetical protein